MLFNGGMGQLHIHAVESLIWAAKSDFAYYSNGVQGSLIPAVHITISLPILGLLKHSCNTQNSGYDHDIFCRILSG